MNNLFPRRPLAPFSLLPLMLVVLFAGCMNERFDKTDRRLDELDHKIQTLHAAQTKLASELGRMQLPTDPRPGVEKNAPTETPEEVAEEGLATTARALLVEMGNARKATVEDMQPGKAKPVPDLLSPLVDEMRLKRGDRILNVKATTRCEALPSGVQSMSAKVTFEVRNAFDESVLGSLEQAESQVGINSSVACATATRKALKKLEVNLGRVLDRALR